MDMDLGRLTKKELRKLMARTQEKIIDTTNPAEKKKLRKLLDQFLNEHFERIRKEPSNGGGI